MYEGGPQFRQGEAATLSDLERERILVHRQLSAILQVLPPGSENLAIELAATVERLLLACGDEKGRAAALGQEVDKMSGALRAVSERLAVVEGGADLDITGVLNKRAFCEKGASLFNKCKHEGKPLACIFVDLDYFKQINDVHGHPAGDRVLADFAKLLQYSCRPPDDIVGRYGGEEFVILLPCVSPDVAAKIMERLRVTIEQYFFRNGSETTRLQVTASLGGAVSSEDDTSMDALIARADEAMYAAKNWTDASGRKAGRNMTVLSAFGEDPDGTKTPLLLNVSPVERLRPRNAPREDGGASSASRAAHKTDPLGSAGNQPGAEGGQPRRLQAKHPMALKGPARK